MLISKGVTLPRLPACSINTFPLKVALPVASIVSLLVDAVANPKILVPALYIPKPVPTP